VPPLFGWEHIVAVLAVMTVVAAIFLVLAATRGPVQERPDWQAWLDARSNRRGFTAQEFRDRAVHSIHPSRLMIPRPAESDLPHHL
jgi:hypothetical protein